jgi:hypothetical protein
MRTEEVQKKRREDVGEYVREESSLVRSSEPFAGLPACPNAGKEDCRGKI